MGLPLALLVALLATAPGPPQAADAGAPAAPPAVSPMRLPPILWRGPQTIDAAWREIRDVAGDGARLVAIQKKGLLRWVCPGLVDVQDPSHALVAASGLAWKDTVRGRGWARPALARVLADAHATWRVTHPTLALAVGDLSQAGCGQIDPGVLTRLVVGAEVARLRASAVAVAGRWASREITRAGLAPDAADRFADPQAALMIERELVAEGTRPEDAEPVVLVRMRRYLARPEPTDVELGALVKDVRAFVRSGEIALEERGPGPDGDTLYRVHAIDAAKKRQAVIVSTARRGTRLEQLRDVRIGPWIPGRPGIFQGEERWIRQGDSWTAWQLIEEGAHATHMAGRDADLSFAHADPRHRFTEALDHVDLAATWAWFVALEEAGRRLGTPVDAIIVGPRIHRLLLATIPGARASPLVKDRILKVVRWHDDHQHIRIAEPTTAKDVEARDALARPPTPD